MQFRSDQSLPSKQLAAQILTLGTAILLTKGHETVQLIGGSFLPGRSEKTLQHFAEELWSGSDLSLNNLDAEKIKTNSALLLVSDFLDETDRIRTSIRPLGHKIRKGLMVQVLDPAEIELSYEGRYIFEGMDTGERESINNVGSIRAEYKQRMDQHMQELKALATRQGWDLIIHRTGEDIAKTLFRIWMRFSTDDIAYGSVR